jgi:hypothetical protein
VWTGLIIFEKKIILFIYLFVYFNTFILDVAAGVVTLYTPLFILAVHREIASPLLPLAFSSFGGRGVGGG